MPADLDAMEFDTSNLRASPESQAFSVCVMLCSRPDILAAINNQLSSLLKEIEDPKYHLDEVWDDYQQDLIKTWIKATAYQASETLNGRIRD